MNCHRFCTHTEKRESGSDMERNRLYTANRIPWYLLLKKDRKLCSYLLQNNSDARSEILSCEAFWTLISKYGLTDTDGIH